MASMLGFTDHPTLFSSILMFFIQRQPSEKTPESPANGRDWGGGIYGSDCFFSRLHTSLLTLETYFYSSISKVPVVANFKSFEAFILCYKSDWVSISPTDSLEFSFLGSAQPLHQPFLQFPKLGRCCLLFHAPHSCGFSSFQNSLHCHFTEVSRGSKSRYMFPLLLYARWNPGFLFSSSSTQSELVPKQSAFNYTNIYSADTMGQPWACL